MSTCDQWVRMPKLVTAVPRSWVIHSKFGIYLSRIIIDFDLQVKKESAEGEPAWEAAGQEVGLQIWRIVKFKVKILTK